MDAPTIQSNNEFVGGSPDFTFIDDPEWRENLTAINLFFNSGSEINGINSFTISEGQIYHTVPAPYGPGVYKWTFKADGYADVVIEFTISPEV